MIIRKRPTRFDLAPVSRAYSRRSLAREAAVQAAERALAFARARNAVLGSLAVVAAAAAALVVL